MKKKIFCQNLVRNILWYLATELGENNPAVSDIKCVSSGLVWFSVANPGVSVSGGQFTVTLILKGASSKNLDNSNYRISNNFEVLL